MYLIINNTTRHSDLISGDWPADLIEKMLYNNEKFIVVSLYSNTIKVPTKGETDWEWEDYNLPSDLLKTEECPCSMAYIESQQSIEEQDY